MGEAVRIGEQDRLLAGRIEPVEAAPESAVVGEAQDQVLGVLLLAHETERFEVVHEIDAGFGPEDVERPVTQDGVEPSPRLAATAGS